MNEHLPFKKIDLAEYSSDINNQVNTRSFE